MQKNIQFEIIYNSIEIIFSTDSNYIKECIKSKPCVLLLNEFNIKSDTMFAPFAIDIQGMNSIEEIKDSISEDYCNLIYSRFFNKAVIIAVTENCIIRELQMSDLDNIILLMEECPAEFVEKFYDNKSDAAVFLKKYIDEVYTFYNYGIWGIFNRKKDSDFIGIAGFTPRDGINDKVDLEIGYAITTSKRNKGYAYEACKEIINYANKNIEFNKIFARIDEKNFLAKKLADKLEIFTNLIISC